MKPAPLIFNPTKQKILHIVGHLRNFRSVFWKSLGAKVFRNAYWVMNQWSKLTLLWIYRLPACTLALCWLAAVWGVFVCVSGCFVLQCGVKYSVMLVWSTGYPTPLQMKQAFCVLFMQWKWWRCCG